MKSITIKRNEAGDYVCFVGGRKVRILRVAPRRWEAGYVGEPRTQTLVSASQLGDLKIKLARMASKSVAPAPTPEPKDDTRDARIHELRATYTAIQKRSELTPAEFRTLAAKLLKNPTSATPEQWVRAAESVRTHCGRCGGTGRFVTYVENGVPKGPGGQCYRCAGVGTQCDADRRRNYVYDTRYRRVD